MFSIHWISSPSFPLLAMARPLISQYLSMLGILLSGTLSFIYNSVRGIKVRLRWVNGDARCQCGCQTQHPDALDSLSKQRSYRETKKLLAHETTIVTENDFIPLTFKFEYIKFFITTEFFEENFLTLLTMKVLKDFKVCYPKVRPMLVLLLLDSLSLIRGVALDVSSLNW
ncbi:uncharacterized protein G2W53_015483 [Senna tora]|uniref:Uncharacterized protein n=1 Tax=Senna tora TaxID=362788 RepID=A0A834WUW1_9FABA|nr:uncharacterized protein G2W53_015483 [Senna tora]